MMPLTFMVAKPAGATLKLHWLSPPSSILVVAKPSPAVQKALQEVVIWLLRRHVSVVLEPQVRANSTLERSQR